MESLVSELFIDEIEEEDEMRINEVLSALSELISCLPEDNIMTINEHISGFY